ncbi:hypothetical protein GSI_06180 [Ganoderma sinense ZZ0214-1]|uniref:Uncharacterized protein n=1 Tax=Ganoderma sinense ZZ0214-1 TaxID=1077348 RepID=A0A2G8SD14_9APHY|nr:hypothetical protein GSI_06180 [Ganoderma sinense ZZ0214-1]
MASSSPLPFDPSRLPSYRSSHVGRFHPYPRGGPRRGQDALMQTVDYRTADRTPGLDTIPEEPEPVHLSPLAHQEIPDGDVSFFELDHPVVGDASYFDRGVRVENAGEKTRLTAITHILTALRRRSLALLASMNVLKSGRWTK